MRAVGDPRVDAELARRVAEKRPARPEPAVLPEPSVPCRPALQAEISRAQSARLALAAARDNGWTADLTYSRGPLIGADGELLEDDVESLLLSASRGITLLRALWLFRAGVTKPKWSLECAYLIKPGPFRRLGGNDIRPLLQEAA